MLKISKSQYEGYVYDVGVFEHPSFEANGFVVHNCGFWTAKKRYALMVYDSEGVRFTEPKTKVMGLEIVKSSTPEKVREDLKGAVKLILTTDENTVQEKIKSIHSKFMEMKPEEMASPRGANNLEKFAVHTDEIYGKGTPKHVKAALVYNYLVKKHELDLEPIGSGNKIKFIDLNIPNPTGQTVVGWPSHLGLPEEFGLNEYIDKNTSYEKTFLKPMETMLDAVGWKSEIVVTLEDFF